MTSVPHKKKSLSRSMLNELRLNNNKRMKNLKYRNDGMTFYRMGC